MKVILLKNVPGLGSKNELKEVSTGYATNYLFPHQYARDASLYNEDNKHEKRKEEEEIKQSVLFNKINNLKLKFYLEAAGSEKSRFYGSVSANEIVNKLKEHSIKISDKNIDLKKSIKDEGIYKVEIKLSNTLKPVVIVEVSKKK